SDLNCCHRRGGPSKSCLVRPGGGGSSRKRRPFTERQNTRVGCQMRRASSTCASPLVLRMRYVSPSTQTRPTHSRAPRFRLQKRNHILDGKKDVRLPERCCTIQRTLPSLSNSTRDVRGRVSWLPVRLASS